MSALEMSQIESVQSIDEDLAEQNASLRAQLQASRRQCRSLEQSHSELKAALAQSEQKNADLQEQNQLYFFSIMDLEARHIIEQQLNAALARSNTEASESIAHLEAQGDLAASLAAAQTQSTEVVRELQARAKRLTEALEKVRVLQGIISICMHCHNIRDDGDVWNRLEEYMSAHSDVRFSHGLCPPCLDEHYGEE